MSRQAILWLLGLFLVLVGAWALMSRGGDKSSESDNYDRGAEAQGDSVGSVADKRARTAENDRREREKNRDHMPDVIEWQGHYLVLQGENHLPVDHAVSTPFATLYQLEPGYIPSSPMGKIDTSGDCYGKWYAPDRPAGTDVSAMRDSAEAMSGSQSRNIYEAREDCPRELGEMESGSYVFDKDGNPLAGFDFSALVTAFEVLGHDGGRYVVFPEGGNRSLADPAIDKMELTKIFVTPGQDFTKRDEGGLKDRIRKRVGDDTDDDDIIICEKKPDNAEAGDLDDAMLAAVQKEIEALIKRRSKDKKPGTENNSPDALIVIRGPAPTSEDMEEIVNRNRAKIKKALADIEAKIDAHLTLMSFGNEMPICNDSATECYSLNRSISVYSRVR